MDTDIRTYIEYIEGHYQNINYKFRKFCQCTILDSFSQRTSMFIAQFMFI